MKKIVTYLLAGTVVFAGCQKKTADSIQGKAVDERLSAELAAYRTKLTQSPYGWILIEYTNGEAINQGATTNGPKTVFAYYMQFTDSNSVTMFSDFDTVMAVTPKVSSYRVKAVQRPSLIFDTYSYIHVPCDPDPSISLSPFGPGLGWGADFEFSFADNVGASQLGDTIHLTGNLNGSKAFLVKASQADHDAYYSGALANSFVFDKILNYFKHVNAGSTVLEITPGVGRKIIDINWLQGGVLQSSSTSYYQTADGIHFATPITVGSQTVSDITGIVYDAASSTATATVNGSAGTITGATAPLKYNLSAPGNWYNLANSTGGLWISIFGFHVNGVDDALGVTTITDSVSPYFGYCYFPNALNGYDVFSPLFFVGGNTVDFPQHYLTIGFGQEAASGITNFTLMDLGTPPPSQVTATNTLMMDPSGFYFIVKEDGTTYDMVIGSDAKSWLRWDFIIH